MAKKSDKKSGKTKAAKSKSKQNPVRPKLPAIRQLTKTAWQTLWRHKKLFLGITLIYGALSLSLVQGLAGGTDLTSLKNALNQASSGGLGSLGSALSILAVLMGSVGNGSGQTAGAYQLPIGIMTSLAVIWALRQVLAGKTVRIRDAYYQGMYPLVPFVLVLLVVGLQLIPFVISSTLYNLVVTNGIAVNFIERMGWLLVFLLGASWSIYLVSSSLFAVYIVTLPDMTPLKALRSARDLVKGRRWPIILRLLSLPVILMVVATIIMVPIIIVLTFLAKWVFFLLTMFALAAIHAYLYTLYRELLDE